MIELVPPNVSVPSFHKIPNKPISNDKYTITNAIMPYSYQYTPSQIRNTPSQIQNTPFQRSNRPSKILNTPSQVLSTSLNTKYTIPNNGAGMSTPDMQKATDITSFFFKLVLCKPLYFFICLKAEFAYSQTYMIFVKSRITYFDCILNIFRLHQLKERKDKSYTKMKSQNGQIYNLYSQITSKFVSGKIQFPF